MAAAVETAPSLTGKRLPSAKVAEIQRLKIVAAAVQVFDERGFAQATVADITARARVSRTAFYELFADRDACLAAILDEASARAESELVRACLHALPWADRIRTGLTAILDLMDREPALARVCVVEAPRGGPPVLERRAAMLSRLARAIDEGRREHSCALHCSPVTAEGLVGGVFAIVHSRLLRGDVEPFGALAADLTLMLQLPYVGDAAPRRPWVAQPNFVAAL